MVLFGRGLIRNTVLSKITHNGYRDGAICNSDGKVVVSGVAKPAAAPLSSSSSPSPPPLSSGDSSTSTNVGKFTIALSSNDTKKLSRGPFTLELFAVSFDAYKPDYTAGNKSVSLLAVRPLIDDGLTLAVALVDRSRPGVEEGCAEAIEGHVSKVALIDANSREAATVSVRGVA